jgi:uncharacterized membrane protein YbhN (UPF0104 family)
MTMTADKAVPRVVPASLHRRVVRLLLLRVVPVLLLVLVVLHVGAAPFLDSLTLTSPATVAAALGITVVTTVLSAWRWQWVCRRLGEELDLRSAVVGYYRSLLLNQTLPGGVLGDVHRALRHGGSATRGTRARAVAWERFLGQMGLLLVFLALVALPWSVHGEVGRVLLVPVAASVLAVVACLVVADRLGPTARRVRDLVQADLRLLRGHGSAWAPVLASVAAAVGHLALMFLALRVAGVDLSLSAAAPLLTIVLVASSLPTNIAGWGPREGAAAWTFAAAGLEPAAGVTMAALYGVLTLVASAPGALVLALDAWPARSGGDPS